MNAHPQVESVTSRILVWDLPTRIFHWSLAATFAIAYLTAEVDQYRLVHLLCGYLFVALIGFRLVWGVLGSRYARFAEFLRSPSDTLGYLRSWFKGKPDHFIGHNPLGAMAILLMLVLGIGIGITGWLNVGDAGGEIYEEVHEAFASTLLLVVAIHIVGVLVSSRLHRENLARAMVTGYKSGPVKAGIPRRHGIVAVLLVAALAAFGWALSQGQLPTLLDPAAIAAEKGDTHGDVGNDDDDDDD